MTSDVRRSFLATVTAVFTQVALASPPALAEGPFPFFFKRGGPSGFPSGGPQGPFPGGDFDRPDSFPRHANGPRYDGPGFEGPFRDSGDDFPLAPIAAGLVTGSVAQELSRKSRTHQSHEDVDTEIAFEPWTREWYAYCSKRYRTFNPDTGTYKARGGRSRFCTLN
jgi:BA14K-like protein